MFANKGINSGAGYSFFKNIDKVQDDSLARTTFVWSRSLHMGNAMSACGVNGGDGGRPDVSFVDRVFGVVACFCI